MTIVVDTNVIVSGLLSPFGPPGQVVRLIAAGKLRLYHDARILTEYREVLHRPVFGFDPLCVAALLDQIEDKGCWSLGRRSRKDCPMPTTNPSPRWPSPERRATWSQATQSTFRSVRSTACEF